MPRAFESTFECPALEKGTVAMAMPTRPPAPVLPLPTPPPPGTRRRTSTPPHLGLQERGDAVGVVRPHVLFRAQHHTLKHKRPSALHRVADDAERAALDLEKEHVLLARLACKRVESGASKGESLWEPRARARGRNNPLPNVHPTFAQRRRHGRAGLQHLARLPGALHVGVAQVFEVGPAVVLVAPYHQVQEGRQVALLHAVLCRRAALHAVLVQHLSKPQRRRGV
eukprot:365458-Chlamydomonas_euryale.AAC.5